MHYNRLNNITGWTVFLIATIVYFITLESTASLWDCGEYITAANKLEVGHPPGAPLFMVLGRLFSFFAEPEMVAVWINRLSALSSSFTILFMFWSITMLGKKIMKRVSPEWNTGDQYAVLGAGVIGSLAYTFSDSFWFSAVEGEVYAMSSLFTAAIFWAILKWDVEMTAKKNGEDNTASPMRWMILIMFLFGLAIGVHLLGLLVVPAIAYVMYFNMWEKTTLKGIIITGIISVVSLGFIQEGIIPGIVAIASSFEVGFVNGLGMPFFSGTIFFFILVIALLYYGFRYSVQKAKPLLNNILWGFVMLLIGYGSFAVIVIRSSANTPLDENDPENLVTLHAYLKREQYGSWPILTGPYWNSLKDGEIMQDGQPKVVDNSSWGDLAPFYLRRYVVELGGQDIKAFKVKEHADAYAKKKGAAYTVTEKYFSSNEKIRKNALPTYSQSTFLPRMYYSSDDPDDPKIAAYKDWSGYDPTVGGDGTTGRDGLRLPSFGENLTYMGSYQINWMYWRYFMWNFAGRQNDIQGEGGEIRGNWQTGLTFLDEARLGSQEYLPSFTEENTANNKFFLLPLILGLLGMIYHIYRSPKDAFVVFLTFLFTGMAIVIYLNQKPFEPRERDYAYAASFYAFALWIGFAVLAMYEAYKNFKKAEWSGMIRVTGGVAGFAVILTLMGGFVVFGTFLYILLIAAILLLIGWIMRKVVPNNAIAAVIITLITLTVPYIMGEQGWDDHDRSDKTSAQDLAYNYLMSCAPNSILFTAGDNDTFPLWYLQEVEGKYTDIRVCNTSLFDTDWYTDQMMLKTYGSEPLPISFREDQILMFEGGTDQALFASTQECLEGGAKAEELIKINDIKIKANREAFNAAYTKFAGLYSSTLSALSTTDANFSVKLAEYKKLVIGADSINGQSLMNLTNTIRDVVEAFQTGVVTGDQQKIGELYQQSYMWEDEWAYLPINTAMDYVKEDDNMLTSQGNTYRAFPCKGFIVPVNADNVVKSGLIKASDKSKCDKEVRFKMDARGITKSDIMILDMMANNKWKRAMYFSSPGGTDVSMALYRSGYLRQNGMAWEVSPIKVDPNQPYNVNVMYDNLMNRYHYGQMKSADVLTDYYARRHMSAHLRGQFAQLATYYLNKSQQEEMTKMQYEPLLGRMRTAGDAKRADSLAASFKGMEARVAGYKKKAIALIQKSLEVMPADIVIDYGERPMSRTLPGPDRNPYTIFQDGNLHEYVSILYRAGAKKEAEKLGNEVADQLEKTLNYFINSTPEIAGRNCNDLAATVSAYLEMHDIATDPEFGSPNSAFAGRLKKMVAKMYNSELPRMYSELQSMAVDNGEVPNSTDGHFNSLLNNLKYMMDQAGQYYGVIQATPQQGGGQLPNMPLDNSEAILQDSAIKEMDDTGAAIAG